MESKSACMVRKSSEYKNFDQRGEKYRVCSLLGGNVGVVAGRSLTEKEKLLECG